MRVPVVVTEVDHIDPIWSPLVATARGATPYHHPALVLAAANDEGLQPLTLVAHRGPELAGALSVAVRPDGRVLPRALAAYSGPLVVPSPSVDPVRRRRDERVVMEALLAELVRRHPVVSMRFVPNSFDVRGLIERGWLVKLGFTYHVDITDLDRAWRRISENRRRLIRRAERALVSVREVTDLTAQVIEWVSALHDEQHLRYDDGHPALDLDGWRAELPRLLGSGATRLFVAENAAVEPVAFALMTTTSPLSVMVSSGATRAALDDGATALLRWEVMQRLSAEGVGAIDLGGARPGPVGRFKASFGGELVDRWELRSPPVPPTWATLPRRAAHQVRSDLRTLRSARRPG